MYYKNTWFLCAILLFTLNTNISANDKSDLKYYSGIYTIDCIAISAGDEFNISLECKISCSKENSRLDIITCPKFYTRPDSTVEEPEKLKEYLCKFKNISIIIPYNRTTMMYDFEEMENINSTIVELIRSGSGLSNDALDFVIQTLIVNIYIYSVFNIMLTDITEQYVFENDKSSIITKLNGFVIKTVIDNEEYIRAREIEVELINTMKIAIRLTKN